jgi:hypothetical protein
MKILLFFYVSYIFWVRHFRESLWNQLELCVGPVRIEVNGDLFTAGYDAVWCQCLGGPSCLRFQGRTGLFALKMEAKVSLKPCYLSTIQQGVWSKKVVLLLRI